MTQMSFGRKPRPQLKLVSAPSVVEAGWAWFCGHCGTATPGGAPPAPSARVCPSCNLGLLLESRRDVVPSPKDAFLVIDSALLVQAVSRRAETLLGVSESLAVNQPLKNLLVSADAEAGGSSRLIAAVADVVHGDEPIDTFVRPWNTFGVRMRATVAPCGPPRAALVVLDRPRPRLRAV